MTEIIKVAIIGMENAGKSTIVDLITNKIEKPPESPPNMSPTKGVAKNPCLLNEKNIVVWDFGGQELYRTDYMENPNKYFGSISFLYYVVDVQDYYRVMTAEMYFSGVFQFLRKLSPNAKIIILFHKMDPNFDPSIKKVKERFLEKAGAFLKANKTPFETFDTTIFDLSSIQVAFRLI